MAGELLSSKEAARQLGVKLPTLYAYVSRGLLHSEPGPDSRSRFYRRSDVEALRRQVEVRRDPERAAATALDWGTPVLDSKLTLIRDGTYYYRGLEVPPRIGEWTLEQVAALLWCDDLGRADDLFATALAPFPSQWRRLLERLPTGHPSDRMQHVLRFLAAQDPGAGEIRADRLPSRAALLLGSLAGSISQRKIGKASRVAEVLARAWEIDLELASVLDAAMVACADHELNVSSFTARCVASARASLYDVVAAGLAALRGTRHGGHSDRVEAQLQELGVAVGKRPPTRRQIRSRLESRLRRGERLPGYRQPLYPQGDPRYGAVLAELRRKLPRSALLEAAVAVAEEGGDLVSEHPTIDYGLATVSATLGLPSGSAFVLFALGRTVGWIAHAIEQVGYPGLIRPRARYVGRLELG